VLYYHREKANKLRDWETMIYCNMSGLLKRAELVLKSR